MFSYQFHIRDYVAKTRHLSLLEDLAYRRLIDSYYTEEAPLPADTAMCARLIAMREHQAEVECVLKEFFVLQEDGWHNDRCDHEIGKYHKLREDGVRNAAKRWGTHRDPNGEPNGVPNAKPMATRNQKPRTNVDAPDGVDPEVWSDFVSVRKKRGALVTERVINGIKLEAERAGITFNDALNECVVRGWQSFKSDWYLKDKPKGRSVDDDLRGAI